METLTLDSRSLWSAFLTSPQCHLDASTLCPLNTRECFPFIHPILTYVPSSHALPLGQLGETL